MSTEVQETIPGNKIQIKKGLLFSAASFTGKAAKVEEIYNRALYYTPAAETVIKLEFEFTSTPDSKNPEDVIMHQIIFEFQDTYLQSFSAGENPLMEKDFSRLGKGQNLPVCCNSQMMLQEIIKDKHKGIMQKIFLESKALGLLSCTCLCYAETESSCSSCKFLGNSYDKEKILSAKEFILNNLDKTTTIDELSKEVGINQCYLKKGFKELFGSTIFDFVQEQRILKAKMMLANEDISVGEVAEAVGYSNISNFSNAFKKLTGISPKEVQRN